MKPRENLQNMKKIDEVRRVLNCANNLKFLIEHNKKCNYYTLKNLKYNIKFIIELKQKPKTIDEFLKYSKITFFSIYGIRFGKVNKDGTYNLSEFYRQLVELNKRIVKKYKLYFMAAEKMELESIIVNI